MRVDFYILEDASGSRELLSCRITEKAYKSGLRVFMLVPGRAQAARLDELLWTFRDGSFVPHALSDAAVAPETPVLLGTVQDLGDSEIPAADVMINLTDAVPDCHRRFERVVEIVDATAAGRSAGRERFRRYRELGLDPQLHRIG